jgi:NADH:ubiquinone oxidoreductase subunit E
MDQERLETILSRYEGAPTDLIPVLQDIQEEFNYLPKDELKIVATRLGVPLLSPWGCTTYRSVRALPAISMGASASRRE